MFPRQHPNPVQTPPLPAKKFNRAHARIRAIGERLNATRKAWKNLIKIRRSPHRTTAIVQAILAQGCVFGFTEPHQDHEGLVKAGQRAFRGGVSRARRSAASSRARSRTSSLGTSSMAR